MKTLANLPVQVYARVIRHIVLYVSGHEIIPSIFVIRAQKHHE